MKLSVFVQGRSIAHLFRERDHYLLQYLPNAVPADFVSLTMPVQTSPWLCPRVGNSVFASATLGNAAVDGAPVLRASSTIIAGNYNNVASAAALQSYTWDGTGTATRTFGGTLTYSQSMTSGTVGPPGVNAIIEVFTLPTGQSFNAGVTSTDNMNALLGITGQSGSQSLGDNSYQSSVATAGSTGDASGHRCARDRHGIGCQRPHIAVGGLAGIA